MRHANSLWLHWMILPILEVTNICLEKKFIIMRIELFLVYSDKGKQFIERT